MQLTKINGEYDIYLPKHRAERKEWLLENGGWEVKRIEAMIETIGKDDIVFDIGTEEGDISAIIQKYTGCDMVLFEPNDRVWSCIKAIWQGNHLKEPLRFYPGFLSNSDKKQYANNTIDWAKDEMMADHGFKQLYENYPDVPQIKLDDYCKETGIYPTVITMDVEGAEFEVMKGAEQTLREHKPIIFMSVHPEFMYIHYEQWVVHMLRFIDECGYMHDCIEYDYHELHMKFTPL